MCEPTTILAVSGAVSTVAQGYSARQQGKAAQRQGVYEDKVAQYNARNMENEATRIRNKGTEEEMRHREQVAQLTSRQRAAQAASGVDIDSGSPLQIQEDAELMGELDALRIRSNFSDEARVRDDQAGLTRAQGKAARAAGNNAKSAGDAVFMNSVLGAGTSLLASGVASKWFSKNSMAMGASKSGYTGSDFSAWLKG